MITKDQWLDVLDKLRKAREMYGTAVVYRHPSNHKKYPILAVPLGCDYFVYEAVTGTVHGLNSAEYRYQFESYAQAMDAFRMIMDVPALEHISKRKP